MDSLFTYVPGQSPATFNNPDFVPIFDVSDLPFSNTSGVVQVCGDSFECLFDIGATGDIDAGLAAVEVETTYNETVEDSRPSKWGT
jgi:deleted-in-malignant-brain-tumors protein 1